MVPRFPILYIANLRYASRMWLSSRTSKSLRNCITVSDSSPMWTEEVHVVIITTAEAPEALTLRQCDFWGKVIVRGHGEGWWMVRRCGD